MFGVVFGGVVVGCDVLSEVEVSGIERCGGDGFVHVERVPFLKMNSPLR